MSGWKLGDTDESACAFGEIGENFDFTILGKG
jgi:hypothetical protein